MSAAGHRWKNMIRPSCKPNIPLRPPPRFEPDNTSSEDGDADEDIYSPQSQTQFAQRPQKTQFLKFWVYRITCLFLDVMWFVLDGLADIGELLTNITLYAREPHDFRWRQHRSTMTLSGDTRELERYRQERVVVKKQLWRYLIEGRARRRILQGGRKEVVVDDVASLDWWDMVVGVDVDEDYQWWKVRGARKSKKVRWAKGLVRVIPAGRY